MFFTPKQFHILSSGFNAWPTKYLSIHAEMDAFERLPNSRRMREVDLLVIRTSRQGYLGNSRPCRHCLQRLETWAPRRGYRIRLVFFTTSGGVIASERFFDMIQHVEGAHVTPFYRRPCSIASVTRRAKKRRVMHDLTPGIERG